MKSIAFFMALAAFAAPLIAADMPAGFPNFIAPGHEKEMASIRALFWHHFEPAGPLLPVWDEWMPMSTLWPAISPDRVREMRANWVNALSGRIMDADGYVASQQHDGLGHAEGWPFPLWTQAGGMGWQFKSTGVAGYDAPLVKPDGWKVVGGKSGDIDGQGWIIELTDPQATIMTPAFAAKTKVAPFLRLNWYALGLAGANCYVEWTTKDQPEFSESRRAFFSPAVDGAPETRTMIRMYGLPNWTGTITGLRIHFDNRGSAKVTIKSFHTACDTRQSINNLNFIRGCYEYFVWTRDLAFLRSQIDRIRTAMRFTQHEFDTQNHNCLYTTWPGHEGRSGVVYAGGKKEILKGEGIGSNYWDILPFGGEDALGTIYYYDAVRDLADLEEQIKLHPQWNVTTADAFEAVELRKHAEAVRAYGQKRFWNPATGRFGTVNLDGKMHDYGFTFLNNEAVYYGFASPEQAKSIHAWMRGERIVQGDTSTGADIYHWRFGPRATTKRNLDYYFWAWSNPESINFGDQVQDGGAVLGFSYHDLMARLMTAGPDDAESRLSEIARWFDETQVAGGYRKYYAPENHRGTMQGGNVAGGLGLDREFFESILVPQVMLYGFLGFHPTVDGFAIDPKLPSDWPSLTVTHIALHQHILDITATKDNTISIAGSGPSDEQLSIKASQGWKVSAGSGLSVKMADP